MPSALLSSRFAVYFVVGAGALVVLLATLSLWQLAAGIDGQFARLWLASSPTVRSQPAVLDSPWINVLQGAKQYDDQGNELWNMADRLLPDEHYLIAGNSAGLTNQVMSVINAVHVAILTDRTPILPFFYAVDYHLGPPDLLTLPIPNLPFLDLFDLPLLLSSLRSTTFGKHLRGLVDISEVLEIDRSVGRGGRGWPEQVGEEGAMMELNCWTTWEAPYGFLKILRIDPTFTFLPPDAKPEIYHPTYQGLVKYLSVEANRTMVEEEVVKLNETQRGAEGLPGEWIACVDNLYFAFDAHSQPDYFMDAWSKTTPSSNDPQVVKAADGPWKTVGQYAKFAEPLLEKVENVLREVFGKEEGEVIPKYISVHMRHGDFLERCQNDPSHPSCFSQASFATAVAQIQSSLLTEKGLNVTEVLFTTDETNPDFFEHARERGWKWVDDELSLRIRRQWGDWYPTLVDKVLLAGGAGFVGTQDSTMSIFSANRVEYWNDGLTMFVDRYSPAE